MITDNTKLIAIFCSLASATLFSFTHVIIKYIGDSYHAYHIAFWNDIFALITILIFSRRLGGLKTALQSTQKKFHLLRAISLTLGYLILIVSLTKMPIANAYSLFFTAPILGIILAAIFLKEGIKGHHVISLIFGFSGVLVILRPGFIELNTDMFYPLSAALMFSLGMVFGRKLPPTETKLSFGLYPILVTLLVTGLLVANDFVIPDLKTMLLLTASGFMAGFAVLLAGLAYAKATAAIVAPFEYIQMVWGVLFGFLIFSDVLGLVPAIGSALIIISGLYLIYHEKSQK